MNQLFADGTVNAEVLGEGPPLVLFHSLLSDRASFDRIAPSLARRFRVIVPELPGFGASHSVEGGLPAVADRMAAFVREATAGEDAIVLGNGYGGFVALQMAIRHPGIASRLVLADCGAAFSEPGREAFRNMAAAARAKGLAAITPVAMRRLFAPDYQEAHPELMREREAAFLRTDIEVFHAACTSLAGLDLRPELAKVTVPVLVMVGDQDEATPPPMSEELSVLLPDARLHVLQGCAHVPPLQAPEAFLEAIAPFLTHGAEIRAA
ncbi:alpha/beta fold hydrolase [Rhodopseudomonas sp. RCAM05734]|uniref:alpha/beta fold hydrolase n=1 Tax=Rhodopseudomonas sp. RCAM05734 TaxID=3457549 RepID=UPI004043D48D